MFYGWRIVGLTFLTNFVSVGCLFYSYGVFFRTLQAEMGGSSLSVSLGPICIQLANAVSAPWIGAALTRGSVRRVMLFGALSMAAGFALASRVSSLTELYLVYATLLGVGAAMLGWLSGSTLITQWFDRRRGLALGLSTVGTTLGGAVMVQVSGLLVEGVGWRGAYLAYAILIAGIASPAIWFVVVDRPAILGLCPDGRLLSDEGDESITPSPALASRDVVRSLDFWRIAGAMGLSFGAGSALIIHLVPLAQDRGFALAEAVGLLSLVTICGIAGKLLFGWLSDRVEVRVAFTISTGLQMLGMIILVWAGASRWMWMGSAVFGFGMGGMLPLHAAFVGKQFGSDVFARILGMMAPAMLPIQMLGIPLAGWLRDLTGSYAPALQIFACAYGVAILISWGIRSSERDPLLG